MNRLHQIAVASLLVIPATPVFANPIATEVLRAREVAVPGGRANVQLTYGVEGGVQQAPLDAVTFGKKTTPWTAPGMSYFTNTGSGLRPVGALQMCDCDVPVGQSLTYKVTVESRYSAGKIETMTTLLTPSGIVAEPVQSIDGGYDAGDAPDVLPWNIPDPVEIQGIDCTAACAADVPQGTGGAQGVGGAQGTGGAQGLGGAPGSGGATAPVTTEPTHTGGGSCSLVHSGRPADLLVLAMGLGLAMLVRRKRAR